MTKTELKRLMKKRGASIADVAAYSTVHPTTIQRFLNGETRPHRATLVMLKYWAGRKTK